MNTCTLRIAAAIAALTLPLTAQRFLRQHEGAGTESFLGFAVADIGDIDRDGVSDYAIGASNAAAPVSSGWGRVVAHSGATGALLLDVFGPSRGARFGWSIAGVGDIDGDRIPDFAVGAPFESLAGFEAGAVAVHSGADGRRLWRRLGEPGNGTPQGSFPTQFGSRLGTSIVAIDDLNGDRIAEIAVGAPSSMLEPTRSRLPQVWILDGRTGAILVRAFGEGEFGQSLAVVPDLDGDGRRDLAVGAPAADTRAYAGAGSITVLMPRTQPAPGLAIRLRIDGRETGAYLGRTIASVGDIDGDGMPELLCHGGPQDAPQRQHPARVELRSLRDGSLVRDHGSRPGSTRFGRALTGLGDLDGDGVSEYAIGADGSFDSAGSIETYDGATGSLRTRYMGATGERLGYALASIGDLVGDGRRELLAGAVLDSRRDPLAGRALVLTYAPEGSIRGIGAPCSVIAGDVRLIPRGSFRPGRPFGLNSGQLLRPGNAILFVGLSDQVWAGVSLPLSLQFAGSPCQLLVSPDVSVALPSQPASVPGRHQFSIDFTLPAGPSAFGQELFFQLAPLDPAAPAGFAMSNGIAVRMGW